MTFNGYLQIGLYLVVLLALAKPLGNFMARVYMGQPSALDRVFGPLERLIYRLCGVRATDEMGWKTYAIAMLLFGMLNWMFTWLRPNGALTHASVTPLVLNLFFDGVRNMPGYASQIPEQDRWAIALYIRALQKSGDAK